MKRCLLSALAVGLFITANVMAQVPSYVPTSGLVGYWPFNGNANDESGNGNNGTVNGATLTADRNGVANSAYSFDGVDDYINSTVSNLPLNNSARSFSINIYYDPFVNYNDWSGLMSYGNGIGVANTGNLNDLFIGTSNNDQIYFNNNEYSTTSLSNNNLSNFWHNIVLTYDGALLSNIRIFLDGFELNTISQNFQNITALTTTISELYFGRTSMVYNSTNYYFFKGSIDDIGIWNRALTQEEITNLYNGCSASTITSQPTNQTVNPTTSAQFVVNATSGTSFQWQTDLGLGFQNLSNAGQYSGTNNDTLVVSNASISNNNQQFRCIVNPGSCADTSDIGVLSVSTVGINELSVQGNVSLYPNPTQSSFEILTNLVYSKVEIRDMQGRIVKTENAGKTINLSSLQKGTYSVNLLDEQENTLAVRKIVLQ